MQRAVLLAAVAFACGRGSPSPSFEVHVAGATAADGSVPRIEMETGESRNVEFMLAGTVPTDVTFSADALPPFATLDGPLLTLQPARADAGDFTFTVTASAAGSYSDASLEVVVHRANAPPAWSWSSAVLTADSIDNRFAGICPGPNCTLNQTATVLVNACDPDGDAVLVEVEVVRKGQAFTGVPTYSVSSQRGQCVGEVPLSGLATDDGYAYALRVRDEFGAVATIGFGTMDANGWVTQMYGPLEFDLAPCVTRQCACTPAGKWADIPPQCCSGAADWDSSALPFEQWKCR